MMHGSDFPGGPDGGLQLYFGVYPAIVTSVVPDALGRIEVSFPWLGRTLASDADGPDAGSSDGIDGEVRARATLVSPYANEGQGLQMIPDRGSQVLVAFEGGNLRRPYVLGACWNGTAKMPDTHVTRSNDKRLIKTRSGHLIELDDTKGKERITISTKSGQEIVLDGGGAQVTITHQGGSTITLDASGKVEIRANSTVEVHGAVMNVHAASANFDGMVTCQTLVASTGVVSPSYTPGAGNVW